MPSYCESSRRAWNEYTPLSVTIHRHCIGSIKFNNRSNFACVLFDFSTERQAYEDECTRIPYILGHLGPLVMTRDPHPNIQLARSNLVAVMVAKGRKYSAKWVILQSLLQWVAPYARIRPHIIPYCIYGTRVLLVYFTRLSHSAYGPCDRYFGRIMLSLCEYRGVFIPTHESSHAPLILQNRL